MKRLVIILLLTAACGGSKRAKRDASADIVGTPPTPEEDPFFYVARPPVDAKADKKGTIGDVERPARTEKKPERKAEKSKPLPKIEKSGLSKAEQERLETLEAAARAAQRDAEAARAELDQTRRENALALAKKDEAEGRVVELRAKTVQLEGELEDARKRAEQLESKMNEAPKVENSDLAQCHSCVKLCPLKGKCADDAELVCGWGAGKSRKAARQRATSECDGALQSMRESGAFSRIAGTCPVASCVE